MEPSKMLDIECTNNLTDVQSECNLVLGMAKLKDLIAGLAQQTMRKSQEADVLRREMQSLLEARQRYDDAAAKIAPLTESAKIGLALLLDGLTTSDDPEGNAYASDFRRDVQMETTIDVDLDEIRLDKFPLWKIIREVLRQVPEMRVYELESHLKRFGVKAPIFVSPFICNAGLVRPRYERPLKEDTFRLAFLGRYWRYKGIFFLLDVVKSLRLGPFRLDFYGLGPDVEALRNEVRKQKLEAVVKVHGPYSGQEELSAILSETDLVLLPSEIEGLPLVLMEAMAHGVPFVASNVGAISELAIDNPDVRVVPLETDAFRSAIEDMVTGIQSGRVVPQRLRNYFEQHYSKEVIESRWVSILRKPARCPEYSISTLGTRNSRERS